MNSDLALKKGAIKPSKIICVGRNYQAHATELGNQVPKEPLIFLKPPSSVIRNGESIVIPHNVDDVHYEGEIGVMIGSTGRHISTANAWSVISGIMAVNDVTARKIQRDENQWFKGKGFDTFCPVGEVISVTEEDFKGLTLLTRVNGEERQRGSVSEMIFSLPFLIAYISKVVTLEKGDIVVTGTPAGVGSLFPGDRVEVEIEGKTVLLNQVIKESLHHD